MNKLTKHEYNEIIKAQVITTGVYKGRLIREAEEDSELYYYLQEIKNEYRKGVLTRTNADSQMAKGFFQYSDDDDLADIDDLYGSYNENMNEISHHFGGY